MTPLRELLNNALEAGEKRSVAPQAGALSEASLGALEGLPEKAGVGGPLEQAAWVVAVERLLFDTSRQLGHVLKGETHGLHVPPVLYR